MEVGVKKYLAAFGLAAAFFIVWPAAAQVSEHERRIDALQSSIEKDLEEIEAEKQVIRHLDAQDKELREANLSNDEVRKEIAEARSEMKEAKSRVKENICSMELEYKMAIHERKENLKKAKTALVSYREKLEVSLGKGDTQKSAEYATWVARYTGKIRKDQHALQNAESNRDSNMLSINRKVKQCGKRQTKYVTDYSENAATGTKNINFNRLAK